MAVKKKSSKKKVAKPAPGPRIFFAGNGAEDFSNLRVLFERITQEAAHIAAERPVSEQPRRLDVYIFFSFDLVGSTELKKAEKTARSWVESIRSFYSECISTVRSEIPDAVVWKLIGDEVVFYRRITDIAQIHESVEKIWIALRALCSSVENWRDAKVSVKTVAWLTPIIEEVPDQALSPEDGKKFASLIDRLPDGDVKVVIPEHAAASVSDFLGPNIDAGFRLSTFARKKQLVLSPALAYYLLSKGQSVDRISIVGFDRLKGVARDALFPGIWYHQQWSDIAGDFSYAERYGDELIRRACTDRIKISELHAICDSLKVHGYFFDSRDIDELVSLSK